MSGDRFSDLQLSLEHAGDAKLREIVSLVDSLPERGATDALLSRLRPRLQRIRPPRRMNLTRLLFLPADPVITASQLWRRSALAIPRTALASLAEQVSESEPALCATLQQQLDPRLDRDPEQLAAFGRPLWQAAARVLAQGRVALNWSATTGLSAADYLNIARPLATVLSVAAEIEALAAASPDSETAHQREAAIRACLSRAAGGLVEMPKGADPNLPARCLGMLICVLLARLPGAEAILIAVQTQSERHGNFARLASDSAIDAALDDIDVVVKSSTASLDAHTLARCADLLDTLDQPGPAGRPSRKRRTSDLRRRLGETCHARFSELLQSGLEPKSTRKGGTTPQAVETVARELRQLEAVSRHFTTSPTYDQALRHSADELCRNAGPDTNRVTLARVIEILRGPEAALAVLGIGGSGRITLPDRAPASS